MKKISEEDLLHVYSKTETIWEVLRNKKILITGATGFFGKWLLESFLYVNKKLSLNATLYALSRNPARFLRHYPFYQQESAIRFLEGDILDFEFPDLGFEYIFHAATDADANLNIERPLLMLDTITAGTKKYLSLLRINHWSQCCLPVPEQFMVDNRRP
jgi:nucleoside-diphosphate-sugar epimerase